MLDFSQSLINSTPRKGLKRPHYLLEVMLARVRWYAAYPLSLQHIEEMMQERGVFVEHVTVHRWEIKVLPVLAAVFRRRKRPFGSSWRMVETYTKASGQWKYLHRAVDKFGDAVEFLLTAKRDLAAVRPLLERAINLHDLPEKITIDKSGANMAAIGSIKADACVDIQSRQNKYLNNNVEQDHRAVKRITRPMLGFKSFWSASVIIAGIETMHMIKKGRLNCPLDQPYPQPTSSSALRPNFKSNPSATFVSKPPIQHNPQASHRFFCCRWEQLARCPKNHPITHIFW